MEILNLTVCIYSIWKMFAVYRPSQFFWMIRSLLRLVMHYNKSQKVSLNNCAYSITNKYVSWRNVVHTTC